MATAQQVLDLARSQIGVFESPPGSNLQKYGAAYGMNGQPWCAIFEWWVLTQMGVQMPVKTAGVYVLKNAYQVNGRFFSQPQPGDLAIFNYGDGHTGFVESVDRKTITTIEGNTSSSNGSQTNGGEVARKVRTRDSLILGYCRPAYGAPMPAPIVVTPPQEEDMPPTFTVPVPEGGYYEVRRKDGAVYAWNGPDGGIAPPFFGGMNGRPLAKPICALGVYRNAQRNIAGYWLLGEDGGVFAFGQAPFTDSYVNHPEWWKGNRYLTGIRQHGQGYDILSTEYNTDPPAQDVYDLSVPR